ncbi:MAG: T9SS type A sorting domain-containing protein [Bacteroidetes bacterium]|nr:T9SS C-terminal target domain-containing protein [Bacteroidota bacterium]MBV6460831.1 hypothetical protein [Flavobacteriales bacterium]MCL4816624.1 T9SS type A sorting domain-containing protein [Flavobacteriales bacterium]NOG95668.1 T9SS type A sorting domain-containing protein [Bacteroidota bacterium]WKZ75832.1 MAG: glycine-rich protein [Vicingaceae bacterium]
MKKILLLLTAVFSIAYVNNLKAQSTFNFTGSAQYYVVPNCTDSLIVDVIGAEGGGNTGNMNCDNVQFNGGKGGRVQAKIKVTSGDTIWVYVGGKGADNFSNSGGTIAGGWNGGGNGYDDISYTYYGGSAGGGASDLRLNGKLLQDRVVVAGGGGGSGNDGCVCSPHHSIGGNGGGLTGQDGGNGNGCTDIEGKGATQVAGGQPPVGSWSGNAAAGTLGVGGASNTQVYGGGGGGGGYYGGGGGGMGGGGGGSSYTVPSSTNVIHTQGYQTGNGVVVITPINSGVPVASANPALDTICSGDAINISLSSNINGTTFSWTVAQSGITGANSGSGTSITDVLSTTGGAPGSAIYTVTPDYNGCLGNAITVTILVNPLPTVTFTMQDTVCLNNGTVTLSSGTPNGGTYSGNGVTGNIFDPQVAGLGTHTITYSYTDGNGCSNQATFNVVVDLCAGINEMNPLKNISIYPNPSRGNVVINLPNGIEKLKAEVIDMQGKIVYSENNVNVMGGQANLDLQFLPNGTYQINFTTNNYKHSLKVAVQK